MKKNYDKNIERTCVPSYEKTLRFQEIIKKTDYRKTYHNPSKGGQKFFSSFIRLEK